jgi:hypothetical protein
VERTHQPVVAKLKVGRWVVKCTQCQRSNAPLPVGIDLPVESAQTAELLPRKPRRFAVAEIHQAERVSAKRPRPGERRGHFAQPRRTRCPQDSLLVACSPFVQLEVALWHSDLPLRPGVQPSLKREAVMRSSADRRRLGPSVRSAATHRCRTRCPLDLPYTAT